MGIAMKRSDLFAATSIVLLAAFCPSIRGAPGQLILATRAITWQAGISVQLQDQLKLTAPSGRPVPAFLKFNSALSFTNHQLLQASNVRLEEYLNDNSYAAL